MALKFRRGTTAQKSGSLSFGEPYVNTTLGTLQIGGDTGDITLAGTSANVGISGSSLDITGNAKIDGNLTLGGTITIGDNTSDNVVVNADLSSSIIPNNDNAFDLGSSASRYRAIYGANFYGGINATNGIVSGSSQIVDVIASLNTYTGSNDTKWNTIGNLTGSYATTGSNTLSGIQHIDGAVEIHSGSNPEIRLINTTTGIEYHIQNGDGGHFQIHNGTTDNLLFKFLSGSIADGNQQAQFFGTLYVSKSISSPTITGINSFTGSSNLRLNNLESTSASVNGHISDINTKTGSFENKFSTLQTLTASVNAQISRIQESTASLNSFTSSINTTIKSKLDTDGVVSGSSQITISSTTGFTSYSSSVDSRILTEKGRIDSILTAATADADTFAEIVSLINSVDTTNDNAFATFYTASANRLNNLESTSASVNISVSNINTFTSSINTTIKEKLNVENVVSSSAQVVGILTSLNTYTQSTNLDLARLHESTSSLNAFTASQQNLNATYVTTGSNTLKGNQIIIGSGAGFAAYISTSVNDGTLGLDTTANVNAAYFLKNGEKNFELSYDTTNANGIFRLLPYDNNSFFEIGNPSNSGADYVFVAEPTYGNVLLGPGIPNGTGNLGGAVVATDKVQVVGTMYVSGSVRANSFTGSIAATNGVVSGSSQVIGILSSLNTYTGSNDITNTAQNNRLTNLESTSASVNGHIVDINAYTSSNNTTNTSQNNRLSRLEESTASLNSFSASNGNTSLNSYTSSLNNAIQLTGSTISFLGNIVVYGTQSVINSTNLAINDNLIYLNEGSTITNPDLGIVGNYNDGVYAHSGIFRDASDGGAWKVFEGYTLEPSGTIDTTGNGFTLADFKADVITATSFNGQINATNGVVSGSSQVSYVALSNIPAGIISSSAQIDTLFNIDGLVSGSSQITAGSTTNFSTDVKTQLNNNTVISGSSQVQLGSATGNIALATQTTGDYVASLVAGTGITLSNNSGENATPTIALTNNAITIAGQSTALGSSVTAETIRTAIGTVVTGSSQISHDSTTGYSANRHIDHTAVSITAGSGLTGGGDISTTRTISIANLGVTDAMLAGSISNAKLTNSSITIAGQSTSLGGSVTAETIRTAIGTVVTGSSQINLGSATGNIALATQTTGDYVASLVAGTGVTITNNSGENATPTIAIGQSVATNATPTFGNLTINGSINATGDITAYYTSDKRHKNNIQPITNALQKVSKLNGVTWEWNDDVHEVTKSTPKTGLIAQEVQEVLPEVIKEREDGFLALDYSKMMGLMVEAIKEQQTQIHNLTLEIENLKKQKGL